MLCLHGFTGTPYEVRYLGDRLASAGFRVSGPRLPGHGTRLADLDATRWSDWAGAVEDAFDALRARCRAVAVVGQSLGGLLALHLAARRGADLASVASLAAPLWLDGPAALVGRWAETGSLARVAPWLRAIRKFGGSDIRDPRVRADNPCYDAIPLRALGELMRFMRVVDGELWRVRQPVLVLHATHDHTAPVRCAYRIAEGARAERVRILPRSFHLIAVDVERDVVADEVISFVRRTTRPTSSATGTGDLACAT